MNEIEFLFELNRNDDTHISVQLYENIKKYILNGTYKYKDKLPSIRKACTILSVSKSTVISAYFQLCTEGYVNNFAGKGYFIAKISSIKEEKPVFDLRYKEKHISYINDAIDDNAFPKELWKKQYIKTLNKQDLDLTIQGDEQGEYELRSAVASFIRTHRGCKLTAEQVIIASGIQTLISMLIIMTKKKYNHAFLESPGYKKVEYIFNNYGIDVTKLSVNKDGINVEEIKAEKNSLIYVSPCYQYPLGGIMSAEKRLQLINSAHKTNSLIIEDDYASIIRYDSKPISSLQGMDLYDNTVYLGSFSKTFLPSLRISFMVIPKKLLPIYYEIKHRYTHTCSKPEQLTLASIISSGYMEKHLKKINNIYKTKNAIITKYIQKKYKNKLILQDSNSGFHIVFKCSKPININFNEELKNEFLLLETVDEDEKSIMFSFSYSGINAEEIPSTIDKLVKILEL